MSIATAVAIAAAQSSREQSLSPDQIRAVITHALTADSGNVDLLIRTGGEQRLSDFLLWESAYAELVFHPPHVAGLRRVRSRLRARRLQPPRTPLRRRTRHRRSCFHCGVRDDCARSGSALPCVRGALQGQVHPAGAHRGDRPLLAPDQVLAVSAARPGHARRLSRAGRRGRDRRRARRAAARSTMRRTSSSSRSTSPTPIAPIASPTTTAARGVFVALGGLHVTSLPDEAAPHADAIFLGPGEQTFPQFLADFRAGRSAARLSRRQPGARSTASRRSAAI